MSMASLAATATKLIEKNGRSGCQIYRPGDGAAPDPDMPWKKVAQPDALIVDKLKVLFVSAHEMRGEERRLGVKDLRFQELTPGAQAVALVAAGSLAGVAVLPGDLIVAGSERFSVLTCDPIQPGDVIIAYQMELKN